jgi:hypothetical protein
VGFKDWVLLRFRVYLVLGYCGFRAYHYWNIPQQS